MKDDLMYLDHIIDSIDHIKKYIKNVKDDEDFMRDEKLCDAVIRRLGIIGEASSKISLKTRQHYNLISWRKIIDTRNLLIHGYFGVSYVEVWSIATENVPELEKQIKNIINDLKNKNGN